MKVKAKHNVNYGGVWHATGSKFTIADEDFDAMQEHAAAVDGIYAGFGEEPEPEEAETVRDAPLRRRGRPRKAEI